MAIEKPTRFTDPKVIEAIRQEPCAACGKRPVDPDHIKTRVAGGGDRWENLMPLCRKHHTERHACGYVFMAMNYPGVKMALEKKGWLITPTGLERR